MTREEITKEAQEQVNYCTPLHTEDFIHGYIAGAEPREKRIVDLEKENANLKSIAQFQQSSNMKRYFEIQDLEKENAELKKQIKNWKAEYDKLFNEE